MSEPATIDALRVELLKNEAETLFVAEMMEGSREIARSYPLSTAAAAIENLSASLPTWAKRGETGRAAQAAIFAAIDALDAEGALEEGEGDAKRF